MNETEDKSQVEPSEASPQPQQPKSKPLDNLRDKVAAIPKNVEEAIDNGKGASIFESVQDAFVSVMKVLSFGCQYAVLQQFLLSHTQKIRLCKLYYTVSFGIAALLLLTLIVEFNWGTLLLCLELPMAALLADRFTNKFNFAKPKNPKKHKGSSTPKKKNDTEDYL